MFYFEIECLDWLYVYVGRHLRNSLTNRNTSFTHLSFYEKINRNIFENKPKKMRILLFPFLLIFTFGCATRNIKYDRNKILKKYSTKYKMFVDNRKMNLENIYLDKDNIKNVRIDKRTKELKITQLKLTELFEMKNFILDSLFPNRNITTKRKIDLIIIDGIPLNDSLKEKTKIDLNSIKSISILTKEKMNNMVLCKSYDGDVLLISTK